MKCDHMDVWIRHVPVYGEACRLLVERGRDCTIVDVGCGSMPNLYEMKRHLPKHGIKLHTIGIDVVPRDIEVDRFIQSDIMEVDLPGIADAVVCRGVFEIFRDEDSFRMAVLASAGMLKRDGMLFLDLEHCMTWRFRLARMVPWFDSKIMTKDEALDHAQSCFGVCLEKCPHGITV